MRTLILPSLLIASVTGLLGSGDPAPTSSPPPPVSGERWTYEERAEGLLWRFRRGRLVHRGRELPAGVPGAELVVRHLGRFAWHQTAGWLRVGPAPVVRPLEVYPLGAHELARGDHATHADRLDVGGPWVAHQRSGTPEGWVYLLVARDDGWVGHWCDPARLEALLAPGDVRS